MIKTNGLTSFGLLLLGASLLSATGCTSLSRWYDNGFEVGPDYCRPGAEIAPDWLEEGGFSTDSDPEQLAYWWRSFNDPTLNVLIDTVHQENLTLKAACFRIQEARAVRGIAAGNLFPQQQEAAGAYSRSETSDNTQFGQVMKAMGSSPFQDNWQLGFNAAWELDFWGRFRRALESADANLDAQVYEYDNILVLLEAETAANYIQIRTLEQQIDIARANLKLQQETVAIVTQRFDAGQVSQLDVHQAKAEVAITESVIPTLQAARRKALNRLCILMASPPQNLEALLQQGAIPSPPRALAIGIPAELLTRRPDIRQAERQLAAQCARIGVAESELYPHIAITGSIGLESEQLGDLFRFDSMRGSIGPGFRWNLLNYGRILNSIRVEDARFQQALLNYRETVLLANEEVENGLYEYLRQQARVELTSQSVRELEQAVELALLQYEEGLIDYQRVLDTQRGLVQQQGAYAESRGLVALNLVSVYKALGGGWQIRCARPVQ